MADINLKGLSFLYLNVRSLYNHIDEIFLKYNKYDILCFGETWLNKKIPDNCISKPGYQLFRQDRYEENNPNKRGGGLIVYVQSKYGLYSRILNEYSKSDPDLEQLWITVTVPNHKKMLIINTYRPPSGKSTKAIENLRKNLLSFSNLKSYEIIIMGDLNIDLLKTHNTAVTELKELCRDFNLTQLIKEPTHITPKCKSILDLIITNMDFIKSFGVHRDIISDHLPIYVIRKKERERKQYKYIESRNRKKYNRVEFQKEIENDRCWLDYWKTNNVEEMWGILYQIILDSLNRLVPKRRVRLRVDSPEWFTNEVLASIRYKNTCYQNAITNTDHNESWTEYKRAKRHSKNLICTSKATYTSSVLDNNRSDPKKFWAEINSLLGCSKGKDGSIGAVQTDSGDILRDLDAAEYMNEYYTNIGDKLAKKFDSKIWVPHSDFPSKKDFFNTLDTIMIIWILITLQLPPILIIKKLSIPLVTKF